MSSTTPPRKRTIQMPECRSRQVAAAAAHLDITGEEFIQSAITAALLSLAEHDPTRTVAYAFARAAGVSWETLEYAARQEALASLIVTP